MYVLVLGVGLIGCSNAPLGMSGFNIVNIGGNLTQIGDISKNPTVDKVIYLQGQVTNRAPLLRYSAYQLKDATGTIWVFTNQAMPSIGDEVSIKGRLQFQSIPVGGQEVGELYVQQEQLLHRRAGKPQQTVPSQETPQL
ncbi:MAG TPA: hypothetical protein V6C91_14815 [Coleofasciculaceae cyanobacterium]